MDPADYSPRQAPQSLASARTYQHKAHVRFQGIMKQGMGGQLTVARACLNSIRRMSGEAGQTAPPPRRCDNCEDQTVSVHCSECGEAYCSWCDEVLHRAPLLKAHGRKRFTAQITFICPIREAPLTFCRAAQLEGRSATSASLETKCKPPRRP